jgi:putative aldouronate transport system permease protein
MKERKTIGDISFDLSTYLILSLLCIVTLYPFIYIVMASFSDPAQFAQQRGLMFWPTGFSLEGYRLVFSNPMIGIGYLNTIFYVVIGTVLNIFFTSLGAYALSRKNVMLRDPIMMIIVFTMFFGGGLIPTYLLVNGLGLYDTRWALILPGLVGTFNLIIMRTSFQAIPDSLEESARIDGANDLTILFRIILPLSMPVISVMILFYGVGHWNAYFNALIYLRDRDLYPLQMILREILIINSTDSMTTNMTTDDRAFVASTIKYAAIIVTTTPILIVYPFLQKYFVKGVMIGAIKG